jgi:hypothetical protein
LTGDGTNIFVVWQKIDETLTAENCTGMDVLLNNSELFLAKFDTETGSFVEVTQLTDNDRYEYSPVVTLDDGEAVVYYASVAGNQVQEAKAHTLYKYTNKAKSLATKRNYILSITTRDGKVSYVMDVDGDMSTTEDIGVYTLLTYSSTAFKKEDSDEGFTFAAYGPLNERNVLFVSDMYNIYYMENGQRKTVFEQDRSISGNISIVQHYFGTQILWTETEAEGTALYTVCYSGFGWTKPVKLAQLNGSIRDLDTAYLYGKPVGVCNTDSNQGTTDLTFVELQDFTDLKLLDYLRIDENTAIPQETMPVEVMVKNLGTIGLGDVCFTISDGIGSEQEVWVNLDLAPGDSKNVTLWYLVPEAYSETTMTVTAAVSGEQDADVANNTVSRVIGKPDLSVTENDIRVLEDGYILNLFVENNSLVDARDVVLTVALDEKNADPI